MLRWLAVLTILACGPAGAQELADTRGPVTLGAHPERIVTLSWALTELVVELDVTPAGMADVEGYREWVRQPVLPDGIADVGLRNEPNLERISALAPDLILASDQQADLLPVLERIAPVAHFELFDKAQDNAATSRAVYLDLARALGREDLARDRLAKLDAGTRDAGDRVRAHFGGEVPPLVPIRLATLTSLRLHGANSMAKAALDAMGLVHAAPGDPTEWGFVQKRVEDLAGFERAIVLQIGPFAEKDKLYDTQMWQFMPFVKAGRYAEARPVWTFGGVFSLGYMAESFADALLRIDPGAAQ